MSNSGVTSKPLLVTDGKGLGHGYTWPRHPSGHLVAPLPGVEMLRDILVEGLVNCRSFRIDRTYMVENPNDPDEVGYSDAVAFLFLVIGEVGLPIRSLQLDCDPDGGANLMDMDRLESRDIQTPLFWTGWAHLEELVLHVSVSSNTLEWACNLVLGAPSLRKLEIGHGTNNDEEDPAFFEKLHSASTLPKLQELTLADQSSTEDFITNFIAQFGHSLRALSMNHIHNILEGKWERVLGRWRLDLPFLERISVLDLVEYNDGLVHLATFPSLSDDRLVPGTDGVQFKLTDGGHYREIETIGVSYDGTNMDIALKELIDVMDVIRWS
ncbi:hypothetical protein MMC32_001950 [Xylographa parallela]|nr:hypothetical protein [Xylographa parallela]